MFQSKSKYKLIDDFWFPYDLPIPIKTSTEGFKDGMIRVIGVEKMSVKDMYSTGIPSLLKSEKFIMEGAEIKNNFVKKFNADVDGMDFSGILDKILEIIKVSDYKTGLEICEIDKRLIDEILNLTVRSPEYSNKIRCGETGRPIPIQELNNMDLENYGFFEALKKKLSEASQYWI